MSAAAEVSVTTITDPLGRVVWDTAWSDVLIVGKKLTFRGKYADYVGVASKLSGIASHFLVWTMQGTPLSNLRTLRTEEDKVFGNHQCAKKVRIVIFDRWIDLYRYDLAFQGKVPKWIFFKKQKEKYNLHIKRVKGFIEESKKNKGIVLYTTTDTLHHRTIYNSDTVDVGYVATCEDKVFCFHSPFALRAPDKKDKREDISIFRLFDQDGEGSYYWDILEDAQRRPGSGQLLFQTPGEARQNLKRFALIPWSSPLRWWQRRFRKETYAKMVDRVSLLAKRYPYSSLILGILLLVALPVTWVERLISGGEIYEAASHWWSGKPKPEPSQKCSPCENASQTVAPVAKTPPHK